MSSELDHFGKMLSSEVRFAPPRREEAAAEEVARRSSWFHAPPPVVPKEVPLIEVQHRITQRVIKRCPSRPRTAQPAMVVTAPQARPQTSAGQVSLEGHTPRGSDEVPPVPEEPDLLAEERGNTPWEPDSASAYLKQAFEGVFRKRAKEDPKLQEENDNEVEGDVSRLDKSLCTGCSLDGPLLIYHRNLRRLPYFAMACPTLTKAWGSTLAIGQDCDLQAVEDDSEEPLGGLAKLMDESGSSSSNNEKLPVNVVHPSRGSEKHHSGTCQPCSFFLRGKCTVAEGCLYCHYEHDRPQRPGKKSRERAKRRQGRAVGEAEAEAETKSFQGSSHGFGSLMDLQRACGGRTAVLANFQAPVSPARAVYTSTAPAPDDEPDLPPLAPGVIRL
ncbi:unnamed protein product [Effrenium voratum]|uniref:C3H1-type domain-containing protein n=1 Tax=Effrenium voratum TaxID=2562239 RepID=A0AA36JGR5_9DINO|nr:unnamed protein product [Effrenium voratum]